MTIPAKNRPLSHANKVRLGGLGTGLSPVVFFFFFTINLAPAGTATRKPLGVASFTGDCGKHGYL